MQMCFNNGQWVSVPCSCTKQRDGGGGWIILIKLLAPYPP